MSNEKRMSEPKQKLSLINPIHLLAVGFGSGLSPIMPGTMGSLAAIPIWWFFLQPLSTELYIAILLVTFAIGVYLCQRTADDMGVHDHGSIVWDEFVGMWIVLLAIPAYSWLWILTAFILFRLLDMWKPWPIRWFDRRVHGGFGIMIDDVIAGVIAALLIVFAAFYMPAGFMV